MDTNIKNYVSDIANEVSSGLSKKQNSQIKTEIVI